MALGEGSADSNPPEREVKDFYFKQMCQLQVTSQPNNPENGQLLAVASKYGLVFVGTNTGVIVFKTTELERLAKEQHGSSNAKDICTDYPYWSKFDTRSAPTHINVNADQTVVSVAVCHSQLPFISLYDIGMFQLKNGQVDTFMEFPLSPDPSAKLLSIAWNPTVPTLFGYCTTSGKLGLTGIKDNHLQLIGMTGGQTPKYNCVCWSPKGKQLVAGDSEGNLSQFNQELKFVKKTNCPLQNVAPALDILWHSTSVFYVAYQTGSLADEAQPDVYIIQTKKDQPPAVVNFEDVCFGNGLQRKPKYYFQHIVNWDVVLATSANALEVAVFGRNDQDKAMWERWSQEDSGRAEFPLNEDYNNTLPVGVGVDYTAQLEVVINEAVSTPPMPVLYLLSTDGVLILYHVIHMQQGVEKLTVAAEQVPAVTNRKQPSSSAPVAVQPAAPVTATPPPSMFPSQPSFDKVQLGSVSSATSLKTMSTDSKPEAKFSFSRAPGAMPIIGGNTANSQSVTPQKPAVPVALSTPQRPVAPLAMTTPHRPVAPVAMTTPQRPVTQVSMTTPQRPVMPVTQSTPQRPAVPATLSTPQRPTPVQSSTPLAPAKPADPRVQAALRKPAAGPEIVLGKKSLTTTGTKKLTTDGERSTQERNLSVDSEFTKNILEEMEHFQKEVQDLKRRSQGCRYAVGSKEEAISLNTGIRDITQFCQDVKESTVDINKDIHQLKSQVFELFAMEEDARVQKQRIAEPRLQHLHRARALDPASSQTLQTIRQMSQYIETSLMEVNRKLDSEWEQHQNKRHKDRRLEAPLSDTLYRTLTNNHNVITSQSYRLNKLVTEMKQLKIYNETSVWQNRDVSCYSTDLTSSQLGDEELSSLADSLVQPAKISPIKRGHFVSPEKQARLRQFLGDRDIVPVKATAPGNLSMSRLIQVEKLEDESCDSVDSDDLYTASEPPSRQHSSSIGKSAVDQARVPYNEGVKSIHTSTGVIEVEDISPPTSSDDEGPTDQHASAPKPQGRAENERLFGSGDGGVVFGAASRKPIFSMAPPVSSVPATVKDKATPALSFGKSTAGFSGGQSVSSGQSSFGVTTSSTPPTFSSGMKGLFSLSQSKPAKPATSFTSTQPTIQPNNDSSSSKSSFPTQASDESGRSQVSSFGLPKESTLAALLQDEASADVPSTGVSSEPSSTFTLGSSQLTSSNKPQAPFSFGGDGSSKVGTTPAPSFAMGSTTTKPAAPFSVGGTAGSQVPANSKSTSMFSFGDAASSQAATNNKTSTFSFGTSGQSSDNTKPSSTFSFGGVTPSQSSANSTLFGNTPGSQASVSSKPAGAFSFGGTDAGSKPSASSFPFGGSTVTSTTVLGGFQFGQSSTAGEDNTAQSEDAGEDTGNEPVSSTEVTTSTSATTIVTATTTVGTSSSSVTSVSSAGTSGIFSLTPSSSVPITSENTSGALFGSTAPSGPPSSVPVSAGSTAPSGPPSSVPVIAGSSHSTVTSSAQEGETKQTVGVSDELTSSTDTTSVTTSSVFDSSAISSTVVTTSTATSNVFGNSTTASAVVFGNGTPQASTTDVGQSTPDTTTTIFGQSAASTTTTLFGQPASSTTTSVFGQTTTSGANSLFGQPTVSATTSIFGQPASSGTTTTFGQPASSGTTSTFGQPASSGTTSTFGQPASSATTTMFGQPASSATTTLFGQPTSSGTTTLFGQPASSVATTLFGQPASSGTTTLFGQPASSATTTPFRQPVSSATTTLFGQPAVGSGGGKSTGIFGQSSASSTGLFGQSSSNSNDGGGLFGGLGGKPSAEKANQNPFGSPTLGSNSTTTNTLFGSQPSNVFGQSPSSTTSGVSAFGGGSSVASQGFGGFGSESPQKSASGFGAAPSFGGAAKFGSPSTAFGGTPSFGSSAFGSTPSFGGGGAMFQGGAGGGGMFGGNAGGMFGSQTGDTQAPSFGALAQTSPTFGSMAQQSSATPTFGNMAQQSDTPSFGGFGGGGNVFGQNSGQSPSFTGYRS